MSKYDEQPDVVLCIKHPTGVVQLNLPMVLDIGTTAELDKYFRLLLDNAWLNGASIVVLDNYIQKWAENAPNKQRRHAEAVLRAYHKRREKAWV